MRTRRSVQSVREVQLDVLDDGVGQQRLGDLLQLGLVGRAVDLEHEVLALADAAHAVVAEAAQRAEHRLPLGVGDLRLEDDVDDHPGHAAEGTWRRHEAPSRRRRWAQMTSFRRRNHASAPTVRNLRPRWFRKVAARRPQRLRRTARPEG